MDAVQRTYGTLGQRIKKFQIVYFVAEKIDSKRIFGIRRKDVDDASSYAELSPHFGDLGALISGKYQHFTDFIIVHDIS